MFRLGLDSSFEKAVKELRTMNMGTKQQDPHHQSSTNKEATGTNSKVRILKICVVRLI